MDNRLRPSIPLKILQKQNNQLQTKPIKEHINNPSAEQKTKKCYYKAVIYFYFHN